jgi:lysophospholipase L1-like esterase
VRFKAALPHLAAAMRSGAPIKIVALGSSSTAGAGMARRDACYPSRLQAELERRHPGIAFTVVNLGVGGQMAATMRARIPAEVLPLRPSLVIWQAGVNEAIAGIGVEFFRDTLRSGIDDLTRHGVDVILLDMQYYPRADRVASYRSNLAVMREVGQERRIPVLHRFDIMRHWISTAQFSAEDLVGPNPQRTNDLTFGCLADILADAIDDGLQHNAPGVAVAPR